MKPPRSKTARYRPPGHRFAASRGALNPESVKYLKNPMSMIIAKEQAWRKSGSALFG